MTNRSETFKKAERLCGIKTINGLFEKGRFLNFNHFRIVYTISEPVNEIPPARILITIPKRYFKKAVMRNLLKRRIREAYRKNKSELYLNLLEKNRRMDIAIIWTNNTPATYLQITESVREMIRRLIAIK
jgi:ribonuclease P protein component